MRGMIKWKPFNTMLTKKDIILIEKQKMLTTKPIISEDRINEINYYLKDAITNNLQIELKYFNKGLLYTTKGKVSEFNALEKYIKVNSSRIYLKNIIKVTLT